VEERPLYRFFVLIIVLVSLPGCAPNLSSPPARPGVVHQRGASGNAQTVQFVVIPNDATCRLTGTAFRRGLKGSSMVVLPVNASPVEVSSFRQGHVSVKRKLLSSLAGQLVMGGVVGFLKSIVGGKGKRFPPLVHLYLRPVGSGVVQSENLARSRRMIESNWELFRDGRDIECRGRNRVVATDLWAIYCDTGQFGQYLKADLAAFDSSTRPAPPVSTPQPAAVKTPPKPAPQPGPAKAKPN